MMKYRNSLSEALQNLVSKGYSLADAQLEESFQSNDWRLDSVEQVSQEQGKTLVIAVSSASRKMKLVFVEALTSITDFSPMTLLRRLFPMHQGSGFQVSPILAR